MNYSFAVWIVLLLFVGCQTGLIAAQRTAPFLDEGIYVTAGLRTFQGHGLSDRYLTWFAGSLLWPLLAAAGYSLAGIVGTRLVALLCVSLAVLAVARATRNLFGAHAAFWTVVTLVLNGPLLALAHLGTYDQPTIVGIGVSFWAVTELAKRDNRRWVVVAAAAFSAGVLGKYPMMACVLPLGGVVIALRRKNAVIDLAIFGYTSAAILMTFFLLFRDQLSEFVTTYKMADVGNSPRATWFLLAYLCTVPCLLAVGGWMIAKEQRGVASALLSALAIWPTYHVLASNGVSATKHIVFGFLFAYPLIGLALARACRSWLGRGAVALLVIALGVLGVDQMNQLDHGWPDTRPIAAYLEAHVQPGDQLMINPAWSYAMYLYEGGRINTPWDIYDEYRVANLEQPNELCQFDWFVDEYDQGGEGWSDAVRSQISACGSFEDVLITGSPVVYANSELGAQGWRQLLFVTHTVYIHIWHNTHATLSESKPVPGDRLHSS